MNKADFHKFLKRAGDSITTLSTNFGTDDQAYRVETVPLDPEALGYVTKVTPEQADKMIGTDCRTTTRY